jgi:hypothetical protein
MEHGASNLGVQVKDFGRVESHEAAL